jgi:16S rRNA (guanine527-N7)-methyltransferase
MARRIMKADSDRAPVPQDKRNPDSGKVERVVEKSGQVANRQSQLAAGIGALGLRVDAEAQARMLRFLELMAQWNRLHNLTAITDPDKMLTHHLLDSLAVARHVVGPRVLDVGSGAGLPGIPLAIALPEFEFVLLDASAKRVRFLVQAIGTLGLENVTAVHGRAEIYRPGAPFNTIMTRAVAAMADTLRWTAGLLAEGGRYLYMKGAYPAEEIADLPPGWGFEAIPVTVPGLTAERHALIVFPA